ncbi:MAG: mercuric transport protein [Idiomarina sp.]|uniref:mercuric transporter MerT family protein n=1 Tax=Idiomarina sp. TaxID=1874361 RepID=UPI001DD94934|nr:mercuric transporter MerT family protein [Idiomarina sp.]NQZ17431.1 mercuric transport protein [Idiomarina sp.]
MKQKRFRVTTLLASSVAALLASVCCLGPLLLLLLGVSGAWIGNLTLLEPYRPLFITVAVVSLLLAGRPLFSSNRDCENNGVCSQSKFSVWYKAIFLSTLVLTLVALFVPYSLPLFY